MDNLRPTYPKSYPKSAVTQTSDTYHSMQKQKQNTLANSNFVLPKLGPKADRIEPLGTTLGSAGLRLVNEENLEESGVSFVKNSTMSKLSKNNF